MMGDRMTAVRLPSIRRGAGWAEHGRHSPEYMIAQIRDVARMHLMEATAILDAPDSAFTVETYIGPYAMKKLEVIQKGEE